MDGISDFLPEELAGLVKALKDGANTLVISNNGQTHSYRERGVATLFRLLSESPETLNGALLADKVIGKGAAALMILGGVRLVYGEVVSQPAVELFKNSGVEFYCGLTVRNIANRAGTGICPVETLCAPCLTAEECLPLIAAFIASMKRDATNPTDH